MFEVLAFVYENFWYGDECPEPRQLERKLSTVGFSPEEIRAALDWLEGLNVVAQGTHWLPGITPTAHQDSLIRTQSATSMRVYCPAEQRHLGSDCLGFISFLESAGVLPSPLREIVIDRAMAAPGGPMSLDDLKLIVLLVYWRFDEEPDALVLDELCGIASQRVVH